MILCEEFSEAEAETSVTSSIIHPAISRSTEKIPSVSNQTSAASKEWTGVLSIPTFFLTGEAISLIYRDCFLLRPQQ